MTRVRFAPSPTGSLHVGGARTALFNFLYARHEGGRFILRVEDTDLERSKKEHEDQLIESLLWMGLAWDEGPDIGGPFGPYRQSERGTCYREVAEKLLLEGKAYEVYAYPEEIEVIHDRLLETGKAPHYSKDMFAEFDTSERRREFSSKGLSPALFLEMPRKEYRFIDLVKGEIAFKEGALGDFAIVRSTGLPVYNFAVVVDDVQMEITHVLRGDDHVSNTLKQMAIYEAMEVDMPKFGHLSMILGPDGKKLSKRHGHTSVEEFRKRGFLPDAFSNFLALLGWSHPDGKEVFKIDEMTELFSLARVHSSPAIFDEKKALWLNGVYIRESDLDSITRLAIPYLVDAGQITERKAEANFKWLRKAVNSVRNGVELLSAFPEKMALYFEEIPEDSLLDDHIDENVLEAFSLMRQEFENLDEWSPDTIISVLKDVVKKASPDRRAFYTSLRRVITGRKDGPEMIDVVYLMGRTKVMERLSRAIDRV